MESSLKASVAELRHDVSNWSLEDINPEVLAALLNEAPDTEDVVLNELERRDAIPTRDLPVAGDLSERLDRAVPVAPGSNALPWSRLVALESANALNSGVHAGELACLHVPDGCDAFFAFFASETPSSPEEVLIMKLSSCRHSLQSEQTAAELALVLDIPSPSSRLMLQQTDVGEWSELIEAARRLSPGLERALESRQIVLLMEYIRGGALCQEETSFRHDNLASCCRALGRTFTLDVLLGNSRRLAVESLNWDGNQSTIVFQRSGDSGNRCVAAHAAMNRRRSTPSPKEQEADTCISRLFELVLLDRATAQQTLLEVVGSNPVAVEAIKADWAPNELAWAKRCAGSKAAADSAGQMSAVKAFNEGIKGALAQALEKQGLFQMIADVVQSWLDTFKADVCELCKSVTQCKDDTKQLYLVMAMHKRLAAWQHLICSKGRALITAATEWAGRRGVPLPFTFHGFLGESARNPILDAHDLLLRVRHVLSTMRVLVDASQVTRPTELPSTPLLVGGATSLCFHVLRKVGVTHIVNCTKDLPEPSREELGSDLQWHRLQLADVEGQDLSGAFDEALRIVDGAHAAGGKVLFHCHEGKSRSVSMCVAYLISRERRTLADALTFVKSKRPIRPNAGFLKQLVALELSTLGSNSVLPDDLPKGKPILSSASRCKVGGS
eukprot:TRINITY_DN64618_c0_g1_i1.p1 TRINITY_DN64618_c0_g1~~TRINITY_DN64618_c0_g1_i1.p1  ORF type:complete len:670 (+),score=118.86 TRINITY_DN64618_c0_g1_i1:37-2046(+)